MSFSLAVVNGDLAAQGDQMQLIFGVDKLKQDLDLWLRERYGIDRFHPSMGSTLEDYIGGVVDLNTKHDIQEEVLRVLENYQTLQLRNIQQAPSKYSTSEMLWSINDVQTVVMYDTVIVTVNVSNAAGAQTTVTATSSV